MLPPQSSHPLNMDAYLDRQTSDLWTVSECCDGEQVGYSEEDAVKVIGKDKIKVWTLRFCVRVFLCFNFFSVFFFSFFFSKRVLWIDLEVEVYHCTAQPLEWNLNSERKAWTDVIMTQVWDKPAVWWNDSEDEICFLHRCRRIWVTWSWLWTRRPKKRQGLIARKVRVRHFPMQGMSILHYKLQESSWIAGIASSKLLWIQFCECHEFACHSEATQLSYPKRFWISSKLQSALFFAFAGGGNPYLGAQRRRNYSGPCCGHPLWGHKGALRWLRRLVTMKWTRRTRVDGQRGAIVDLKLIEKMKHKKHTHLV